MEIVRDWAYHICIECRSYRRGFCTFYEVKKIRDLSRICFEFIRSERKRRGIV